MDSALNFHRDCFNYSCDITRKDVLKEKFWSKWNKKNIVYCTEIPEGAKDDDFCPTESLAGIEWHQTLTKRQAVTTCPPGTLGNETYSKNKLINSYETLLKNVPYHHVTINERYGEGTQHS